MIDIDALKRDKRPQSSTVVHALIDRLEAAESARRDDYQNWMTALDRNAELLAKLEATEKTNREWLRANAPEGWIDNLRIENEALRAKVEQMERQEPVAWLHETRRDSDVVTDAVKHVWGKAVVGSLAAYSIPLYLAPGAQPAPSISPAGDGRALSDRAKRLVRLIAGTHRGNIETHRELYALIDSMAVAVDSPPSEPAPSVPEDWLQHAARMAVLARKLREPDWHFESIREMQRELRMLEEAALDAAQGAST